MYYYRVFVPVYLYVLPFLFPFHTPVELGSILVSAHPFSYTISLYAEKKKSEMLNFLYERGNLMCLKHHCLSPSYLKQ